MAYQNKESNLSSHKKVVRKNQFQTFDISQNVQLLFIIFLMIELDEMNGANVMQYQVFIQRFGFCRMINLPVLCASEHAVRLTGI